MTNKTKQYKMLTMSAIMLITSAVYSNAQIESTRINASQFETTMDVQELINGQSQEIKETLPQPEPQMVPASADFVYGQPKSAFGGLGECGIVNVKFAKQPSLKDAVKMLGPCMKAVTKRYGVMVSASESLIAKPGITTAMPPSPKLVVGIGILVSGKLPVGNTVLVDLYFTIDILHHGSLLGHPAKVEYLGEIVPLDKSVNSNKGYGTSCRIEDGEAIGTIYNFSSKVLHYRGKFYFTYLDKDTDVTGSDWVYDSGSVWPNSNEDVSDFIIPSDAVFCVMDASQAIQSED